MAATDPTGELDRVETIDNLTLVATEVAPRLKDLPEAESDVRYEGVG